MYDFRFTSPAVKAKCAEPGRFFESLQLRTFSVRWCPLGTVGSGALRLSGFTICDLRLTSLGVKANCGRRGVTRRHLTPAPLPSAERESTRKSLALDTVR